MQLTGSLTSHPMGTLIAASDSHSRTAYESSPSTSWAHCPTRSNYLANTVCSRPLHVLLSSWLVRSTSKAPLTHTFAHKRRRPHSFSQHGNDDNPTTEPIYPPPRNPAIRPLPPPHPHPPHLRLHLPAQLPPHYQRSHHPTPRRLQQARPRRARLPQLRRHHHHHPPNNA